MTQGQSGATEFKARGIQSALTISLRISMAGNGANWPYWHVDLNSGSGHNERANCIGSPLAFIQAAESVGRGKYTAIFCDKNLDRISALQHKLIGNRRAECVNWNNRELLPVLAERIEQTERRPHFAWGSILVDPNGYFDDASVPHAELIEFASRFPRMDLLFNLNIRTYQLGKPHVVGAKGRWASKFWPSPANFQHLFNREHWLISNVRSVGGDRFCLFIGRSMKTGDHASLGIYQFASDRGRAILADIEGADAQETAFDVSPLRDLSGVSAASNVSCSEGSSNAARQMDLQLMWSGRDGSTPS